MFSSHMKPMVDILSSVCKIICGHRDYLEVQRKRVSKNHKSEETRNSSTLDDFSVKTVKQIYHGEQAYMTLLSKLKTLLLATDVYVPININENVVFSQRQSVYEVMK